MRLTGVTAAAAAGLGVLGPDAQRFEQLARGLVERIGADVGADGWPAAA